MAEKNKPPRDPIPDEFATFEELADFWDTHDLTDYADQLTPVAVEVSAKPTHEYVITLSDSLNNTLRKVQEREGVPVGTLVNLWIQERLSQYQSSSV